MSAPMFQNPPIVEFALGVQFSPLAMLTSGHFGLFWQEIGPEDWIYPGDAPPIQEQFESFERPKWSITRDFGIHFQHAPPVGRFTLMHRNRDKQIQVQPTRFHLNWKKTEAFKPSYGNLIEDFEANYNRFTKFTEDYKIGPVVPNQWELTYVDSFPQGTYWETPADWARFLPGLFSDLFSTAEIGIKLEHRVAEWSFEILPQKARLHISARPGKWGEEQADSLILTSTARGPLKNANMHDIRVGFDIGHEKAVAAFLRLVDKKTQESWCTQND